MKKNVKNKFIEINPSVGKALAEDRPVVALESTIIAHGMPYPRNVETALEIEKIIRDSGAVPATIAIIEGRVKIGLTEEEIEFLGSSADIVKVSRRDYPVVTAGKMNGATTVAGTMIAAAAAGIRVFVTGGIGGVHRGAEKTFDISADLEELKRTDVTVVSAGAKSILDIGLTLEKLETYGVPVLGYKTDEFPAFYTRSSGFSLNYRVESAEEIAEIIRSKRAFGLQGGILVANPIPAEDEINPAVINEAINQALEEAGHKNIKGKELTPFLLDKIVEITGGDSLRANIALVRNNARLGAEIAQRITGSGWE